MIYEIPKLNWIVKVKLVHIEEEHSNIDPATIFYFVRISNYFICVSVKRWARLVEEIVVKYLFVELSKPAHEIKNVKQNVGWLNACLKPWI